MSLTICARILVSLSLSCTVLIGCTRRTMTPVPASATQMLAGRLAGKWVAPNWDFALTFSNDGTLVRNVEGQETTGSYVFSQDDKRMTIRYADGTTIDTGFAFSADTLVLAMDDPNVSAGARVTLSRSQG